MGLNFKTNTPTPGRNKLCVCGSGLKAKHCHLDPVKIMACNRVANEKMLNLIMEEKHKQGLLTDEEYQNFLSKKSQPVTGKDVDKLIDSAGLTRCCDCGMIVPSGDELCMKCRKKLKG